MKIAPNLLKAYNETLANAFVKGKSEFLCRNLNCEDCPLRNCDCYNLGDVEPCSVTPRTAEEWKRWFESLDKDTAPEQNTIYKVSHTAFRADDCVERKDLSFEDMIAEFETFRKDVDIWMYLIKQKTSVVIPEYMEFRASDAKGNRVIECAVNADDVGKKKVGLMYKLLVYWI